ncbi:uncharacterized protein BXZ73DRAFT_43814 [Epithele typhae]|uniref:uncharacterized protein n=1 Tax=Epithele typhae TaxID=378194 RepID=UPI00200860DF|nr:uncharacterized protein BXZ73DRAFT_43814 [Epithele typhae]KAH9939356.1 hypothetical protein BXZ73DRAFT_43814 [Epithele typhae]
MTGLVIVVTGANGGVGFGICHRLLVQLSSPCPTDARPSFDVPQNGTYASLPHVVKDEYDFSPEDGVTLVMACRDPKRAQGARVKLLALLDKHIAGLPSGTVEHSYATVFRRGVRVELETLDLASVKSALDFGKTVSKKYVVLCISALSLHHATLSTRGAEPGQVSDAGSAKSTKLNRLRSRYPYISHLIFNAGTATYSHLDIPGFVYDLFTQPIFAIQHPTRNIQVNGITSKDHLGYAWQCNVFGHYVVYRSTQDMLIKYARAKGPSARVLWMSSLDAEPSFDPADDWQLTKTVHSYQASKWQVDFLCHALEQRAIRLQAAGGDERRAGVSFPELVAPSGEIHHVTISPGVVATSMSALLKIPIPGYQWLMLAAFWVVRFIGSRHVLMTVYAAAVSAVHLALVPLRAVPTAADVPDARPEEYPSWHSYCDLPSPRTALLRFGSENDRWGKEAPGFVPVPVWEAHPNAGEVLLERFERLYQAFAAAEEDRAKGALT